MDRIEIHGIRAYGYHGVLDSEAEHGQIFVSDVTLWLDLYAAAREDDLSLTVDYGEVADLVGKIITGRPMHLVETVAHTIAKRLMDRFPQITAAEVMVHKPHAPIKEDFHDIKVVARRSRKTDRRDPRARHGVSTPALEVADPIEEAPNFIDDLPDTLDLTPTARTRSSRKRSSRRSPSVDFAVNQDRAEKLVLSLGANQGDAPATLEHAINLLPGIISVSQLYITRPWGKIDQADFYNCIVIAEANVMSIPAWLDLCQLIEIAAGRERAERWAPRTLDIDLISTNSAKSTPWHSEKLTLPHPLASQRPFVIGPWLEIDPRGILWHQDNWVKISEIWNAFSDEEKGSITPVATPEAKTEN